MGVIGTFQTLIWRMVQLFVRAVLLTRNYDTNILRNYLVTWDFLRVVITGNVKSLREIITNYRKIVELRVTQNCNYVSTLVPWERRSGLSSIPTLTLHCTRLCKFLLSFLCNCFTWIMHCPFFQFSFNGTYHKRFKQYTMSWQLY